MPADPRPQLATAADQAPDGPHWFHEIKYDGYRLLARIRDGRTAAADPQRTRLDRKISGARRGARQVAGFETALIDGEIVHLEADGTTDFGHLQDAIANERTDQLVFFAFDLLHLDGYDLTAAALEDRKAALATLIPAAFRRRLALQRPPSRPRPGILSPSLWLCAGGNRLKAPRPALPCRPQQ